MAIKSTSINYRNIIKYTLFYLLFMISTYAMFSLNKYVIRKAESIYIAVERNDLFGLGRNKYSIQELIERKKLTEKIINPRIIEIKTNSNLSIVKYFIPFILLIVPILIYTQKGRMYTTQIILVVILIQVLFISSALFNTNIYRQLLIKTRLGGGIEVSISLGEGENIQSYLFMLTETSFILYDSVTNRYVEVPKSKVKKYSYSVNVKYDLPLIKKNEYIAP